MIVSVAHRRALEQVRAAASGSGRRSRPRYLAVDAPIVSRGHRKSWQDSDAAGRSPRLTVVDEILRHCTADARLNRARCWAGARRRPGDRRRRRLHPVPRPRWDGLRSSCHLAQRRARGRARSVVEWSAELFLDLFGSHLPLTAPVRARPGSSRPARILRAARWFARSRRLRQGHPLRWTDRHRRSGRLDFRSRGSFDAQLGGISSRTSPICRDHRHRDDVST